MQCSTVDMEFLTHKTIQFAEDIAYIGSNNSSTESDVSTRKGNELAAIDRVVIIYGNLIILIE